jgi:hypothetical protein
MTALTTPPAFPGLEDVPAWLSHLVARYETVKGATAEKIGVNDWLLHTHGGMLIAVLVMVTFRRTPASPWPLLAVIAAEGFNEYFDKLAYGSWRWEDTSRDVLFTLLWPMVIFMLAGTGLIKRD